MHERFAPPHNRLPVPRLDHGAVVRAFVERHHVGGEAHALREEHTEDVVGRRVRHPQIDHLEAGRSIPRALELALEKNGVGLVVAVVVSERRGGPEREDAHRAGRLLDRVVLTPEPVVVDPHGESLGAVGALDPFLLVRKVLAVRARARGVGVIVAYVVVVALWGPPPRVLRVRARRRGDRLPVPGSSVEQHARAHLCSEIDPGGGLEDHEIQDDPCDGPQGQPRSAAAHSRFVCHDRRLHDLPQQSSGERREHNMGRDAVIGSTGLTGPPSRARETARRTNDPRTRFVRRSVAPGSPSASGSSPHRSGQNSRHSAPPPAAPASARCNPTTGCVHTNNTAPCSDGNACTVGDVCSGGRCVPGRRRAASSPRILGPARPGSVDGRAADGIGHPGVIGPPEAERGRAGEDLRSGEPHPPQPVAEARPHHPQPVHDGPPEVDGAGLRKIAGGTRYLADREAEGHRLRQHLVVEEEIIRVGQEGL